MTSPRVWKSNHCAKPPWGIKEAFSKLMQSCTPQSQELRPASEGVHLGSCCRRCTGFSSFDVNPIPPSITAVGHCKADELLKERQGFICHIIETGFQFNSKYNFTASPSHKECLPKLLCTVRLLFVLPNPGMLGCLRPLCPTAEITCSIGHMRRKQPFEIQLWDTIVGRVTFATILSR